MLFRSQGRDHRRDNNKGVTTVVVVTRSECVAARMDDPLFVFVACFCCCCVLCFVCLCFLFFFCILFLLLFFVFLLPVFVLFCCTRSCLHSVSSAIVYDVQHLLSTLPPLTWQLQQHRQRLKTKESNTSPQLTRRARPPSCITTSV